MEVIIAFVFALFGGGVWALHKKRPKMPFEVKLSGGGEGSLAHKMLQAIKESGQLPANLIASNPALELKLAKDGHLYAQFIVNMRTADNMQSSERVYNMDAYLSIFLMAMYYEVHLPFTKRPPFPTKIDREGRHDEYLVSHDDPSYNKIRRYSGRIARIAIKLKRLAELYLG